MLSSSHGMCYPISGLNMREREGERERGVFEISINILFHNVIFQSRYVLPYIWFELEREGERERGVFEISINILLL